MLTADLALSWQRGDQIKPRLLNAADPRRLREAQTLVTLFKEHVGRTRGALERAIGEYAGTGTDYRVMRGLTKLLLDRCEFANAAAFDPAEARRALFLKARGSHPVAEGERARVAAEVAGELGCAAEDLLAGLYSDLEARQRLVEFEELADRDLLDRYNVAQAQALLYRSTGMRLKVARQGSEGYRELFGAIKAHRLIHSVKGSPDAGYEINLDGPASLFHRSQKYGVQMAVFLPDLLACQGWEMSAEIETRHGAAFFELKSEGHGLRTTDEGVAGYQNPVREKLLESWQKFDSAWSLEASGGVIDLGETAFVPDFVLRHADGQIVHLEILGFWTPEHLTERLREFEHAGLRNFLLAAWEELRGSREPFVKESPNVVVFKRTLDPAAVEWAAEKLIVGEQLERERLAKERPGEGQLNTA
jgi:predicted nuclease of restriction endonuclease-like RecB superfamily